MNAEYMRVQQRIRELRAERQAF